MLLSAVISFVRARLDEIAFNQDDMISAAQDDRNLDTTIERLLPEAVKVVVLASPAHLLQMEDVHEETQVSGIVSFNAPDDFCRMVYIHASDSEVYVSSAYPFDSPEAQMQLNPYTAGNPLAPVVVQRSNYEDHETYPVHFTYYSMGNTKGSIQLAYIKEPEVTGTPKTIFCPALLVDAVLNELTAKVLEVYGDQRAQTYHQYATTYLAQ